MSEHTAGPWEVSRGAQADAFSIESATKTVANVKTLREAAANARLIAAAPELLAALERIAYEPIGHPEASAVQMLAEVTEIARAAIAKARGEA